MTYNPVPAATGDTLDSTRDQIRTNFTIIRDDFSTNHGAYNTSDAGSHTRIDLVEQTTFPATAADESWMASREYNSRTELAWRPESEALAGDQFILSAMPIRAAASFKNNGAAGLQSLTGRSFNIQSIDTTNPNSIVVTFSVPLLTTDYFVLGTAYDTITSPVQSSIILVEDGSKALNTFNFRTLGLSGNLVNRVYQFLVMGG